MKEIQQKRKKERNQDMNHESLFSLGSSFASWFASDDDDDILLRLFMCDNPRSRSTAASNKVNTGSRCDSLTKTVPQTCPEISCPWTSDKELYCSTATLTWVLESDTKKPSKHMISSFTLIKVSFLLVIQRQRLYFTDQLCWPFSRRRS